jgi:hypothetical protein
MLDKIDRRLSKLKVRGIENARTASILALAA